MGQLIEGVWRTDDAGATWTASSTPLPQTEEADGIYAVTFADSNRGLVVGGNYTKPGDGAGAGARTSDGGRTWTSFDLGGYRSAVAHLGADRWMAVGINGSDTTGDGGVSWRSLEPDVELNAVTGTKDGSAVWAVGPSGAVYRLRLGLGVERPEE